MVLPRRILLIHRQRVRRAVVAVHIPPLSSCRCCAAEKRVRDGRAGGDGRVVVRVLGRVAAGRVALSCAGGGGRLVVGGGSVEELGAVRFGLGLLEAGF